MVRIVILYKMDIILLRTACSFCVVLFLDVYFVNDFIFQIYADNVIRSHIVYAINEHDTQYLPNDSECLCSECVCSEIGYLYISNLLLYSHLDKNVCGKYVVNDIDSKVLIKIMGAIINMIMKKQFGYPFFECICLLAKQ